MFASFWVGISCHRLFASFKHENHYNQQEPVAKSGEPRGERVVKGLRKSGYPTPEILFIRGKAHMELRLRPKPPPGGTKSFRTPDRLRRKGKSIVSPGIPTALNTPVRLVNSPRPPLFCPATDPPPGFQTFSQLSTLPEKPAIATFSTRENEKKA